MELSLQNPVFSTYVVAAAIMVLKAQAMSWLTVWRMMRAVVEAGTARRAQIEAVPSVGKTGTTSSYRDAWFCGFTGNYVAAVWFGNDNYEKTRELTGGTLPTPIMVLSATMNTVV